MAAVSLEELVKVYKVPVDSLGKSCSDEHLTSVSIFFDWRATAPRLGLKEEEIDAIKYGQEKEEEKRLKVLLRWRAKYDFKATYEKLISVLLELGRADHAGKVCQLLAPETGAQPETTASNTMEGAGPSSISATPLSALPGTLPNLHHRDARQLEEEIHTLEDLFLDVVDKAESSLEKAPIDLRKLKRYIIQLPVSVKYQYIKFFAGKLSAIRKAESIEEIFDVLALYWDYMNCSLLEVIVTKFGDEGTKADVEKYLQKLKEFRCHTKVRDYIEKWTHGWPPHFASLTVEVKEEWMDRTLEDLEEFRMEMSRKISFESYALSLKEAESGSLRLCFALQRSFPVRAVILQALKEFLRNEDVLMILFQGVSIKEIEDPYGRSDCLYETQGGSTTVKETDHSDVQRDSEEEVEGTPEVPPTGGSEEDGATATRLRGKLLATESLLEMEMKAKEELQQQLVELEWRARQTELKLAKADLLVKQLCSERGELTAALEQREAQMEWERKRNEQLQFESERLQKENAGIQVQLAEAEGERQEAERQLEAVVKWKGELVAELEAKRMRNEQLQFELVKLQKENAGIQVQLAEAEGERQEAERQLEAVVKRKGELVKVKRMRHSEEKVKGTPEAPYMGGSKEDSATATRLRWKQVATESLLEMERKAKEELQQQLVELEWRARQTELKLEEADLLNKQLCSERGELAAALEQREAQMEWERKEKLKKKESAGLQVHSAEVEGETWEALRRLEALNKKGELLQLIAELEAKRMPDPEKCRAVGPGVESAETDRVAHFQVHLADADGDPCTSVQEVTAELRSLVNGLITPATVVCKTPDTYEASYQPRVRGRHELSVVVNGTPIQGSPFRVYVRHPPHLLGKPVRTIRRLSQPWRVATTTKGEVIVTEGNFPACKFSFLTKDGQRLWSVDSVVGVSGQKHDLDPNGVAVDGKGNIFVTDIWRLFKFNSEGRMLKSVGGKGEKTGQFNFPDGVAIRNNNVYVCDRENHRIQVFSTDLSFISSFGTRGSGEGQFQNPADLTFDSAGNLYVADSYNHRIQVFSPSGTFLRQFERYSQGQDHLHMPVGIHVDHDYVYVIKSGSSYVSVFNTSGGFVSSFSKSGKGEGELSGPRGVTTDQDGFVFVCDFYNNRIQVF